ncbi:MAG: heavy metal translocating P-type ATPase [Chloroflexi bacterium]|nr:heavy metal translocating P-type ATPase [Chloroflexota bacterium]
MTSPEGAVTLRIGGMTCASCVRRVERALNRVEGVDEASVNFATSTARVSLGEAIGADPLVAAVERAGYDAAELEAGADPAEEPDRVRMAMLAVGGVLAVPVIIASMGMDIAGLALFGSEPVTGWLLLGGAGVVQGLLGWRFYRASLPALRALTPNMDVLVALGTTVAFVFSAWVVLFDRSEAMFFDVSAAVLLFVSLGRFFEDRARASSGGAIRALLGLAAKSVNVLREGREEAVPLEQVAVGDVFRVRPGERVALDGVVRAGRSALDESLLTGESMPVERGPGETVVGGALNQHGVIEVEATAVGEDTVLQRMAALVAEAQGSRAPVERVVDAVAAVFVPIVLVLALGTFLGWGFLGDSYVGAMVFSVAVLVIACPCALGLATPTAIVAGTGMGAERGILIRNAEALETAARIDAVVLDKTGTLTEGRPELVEVAAATGFGEEVLALAAAVETLSEHPLSAAVVEAAEGRGLAIEAASGFEALPGAGLTGEVSGRGVLIGARRLFEERGIVLDADAEATLSRLEGEGRTTSLLAVDGAYAGTLAFADPLKASAAQAVATLRSLGVRTIMASGDNERSALAAARALGIDEVHAGLRPEEKLALVRDLQGQGQGLRVGVAGDGINDAAALAQADVSIAMSTGADAAIEASDITLLHGDIARIAEAILLSRATLRTIRQNLGWAFGYNVIAIPIAMAGLLNPIVAGGAMALSSVSVMANSLRLRTQRRRIVEASGNAYAGSGEGFASLNRGPLLALASIVVVLLAPFVVFTGIDRAWWG